MAKILVIDDDDAVVTFMSHSFKRDYEVLAFHSWSEAMPAITGVHIDLALIDVKLKGFQGNHVAKLLRPVITGAIVLFSSHSPEILKKLAEDCGADGFIHKVLSYNKLKIAIDKVLVKGGSRPNSAGTSLRQSSSSRNSVPQAKSQLQTPSAEAISKNDPNSYLLRDFASQVHSLDRDAFINKHPHFFLLQLNKYENSRSGGSKEKGQVSSSSSNIPDDPFDVAVFTLQNHNREGWGNVITVGHSVKSDVVLSSPDVSKFHAYFRRSKAGEWTIRDGRGEYGTYVDHQRLKEGATAPIHSKTVVSFGLSVQFKFLSPEDMYQRVRFFKSFHKG